jgi:hypothetical protein
MFRCVILAAALLAGSWAASAQVQRNFSAGALRGEFQITQAPDILLNRQPARLAPGARIRDTDNRLHVSGDFGDRRLAVNYTLDPQGLVLEVWVLTAEEAARRPWPRTAAEAQAWSFDAAAQTWSRP